MLVIYTKSLSFNERELVRNFYKFGGKGIDRLGVRSDFITWT